MTELFNRTADLEKRRRLRRSTTPAEGMLWEQLRGRKHSIDRFVVDFYCPERHLAIELDGSIHDIDEVKEKDVARENYIENHGIQLLRFRNNEVERNIIQVLDKIIKAIDKQDTFPFPS